MVRSFLHACELSKEPATQVAKIGSHLHIEFIDLLRFFISIQGVD